MTRDLPRRLVALFERDRHPLTLRGAVPEGTGLHEMSFGAACGEPVRGRLMLPEGRGPHPGVLYIHAHGNRPDIGAAELTEGRPALVAPLGTELCARGFAVLCIDLPGFGLRADEPESARAKAALWRGRSLAGQMIGELSSAFDWLAGHPQVNGARVGLFGLSMGATLAYWLGAVEPRAAAVAHLCCFADLAPLIARGAHDRHGLYMLVPGLPDVASNGAIAGLIAPRPQFVAWGDGDPLTPPAATAPALRALRTAYAARPDRLHLHREAGGHRETPAMRGALLTFFDAALRSQ